MSSQNHHEELQHHHNSDSDNSNDSNNNNNSKQHTLNESDSDGEMNDSGRFIVNEHEQQKLQDQMQIYSASASQFIHHALSSKNNRRRRSLTTNIDRNNDVSSKHKHLMRRYIVKRNFPNNQLSKASNELDADNNELELDQIDEDEEDYNEGGEGGSSRNGKLNEKNSQQNQNTINGNHDRLEDDDNQNDLEKSMKMYVPYWDAYDTVNQLFLEMSEYQFN
jgi:hypothetical protein